MSENSPRLDLPYIQPSQAQKHVTHNEAVEILDTIVQMKLEDIDVSNPPVLPAEGQSWALSAAPTGAWTGEAGAIVTRCNNGWLFIEPAEGWTAWVGSAGRLHQFDGTSWVTLQAEMDLKNVAGVGGACHHGLRRRMVHDRRSQPVRDVLLAWAVNPVLNLAELRGRAAAWLRKNGRSLRRIQSVIWAHLRSFAATESNVLFAQSILHSAARPQISTGTLRFILQFFAMESAWFIGLQIRGIFQDSDL